MTSPGRGHHGWFSMGPYRWELWSDWRHVLVGASPGQARGNGHSKFWSRKAPCFCLEPFGGCWYYCNDGECEARGESRRQATQAYWSPLPLVGSRETSEPLLVSREVWGLDLPGARRSHVPPFSPCPASVINKYKRRRFQKTKNLLTGETEADPEMIKVNMSGLVRSWRASCHSQPNSQLMGLLPT